MRKGRLAARVCAAALAFAMLSWNVTNVYAAEDQAASLRNVEAGTEVMAEKSTFIPASPFLTAGGNTSALISRPLETLELDISAYLVPRRCSMAYGEQGKTGAAENRKFGYARVSSRDQNLARQLTALRQAGIEEQYIYEDRQSGKDFNRPGYTRLVRRMREGDELYIKSIDRLGRNYDEILEQWRMLTRSKNVDIIVLDFPLLDTRHASGGLTGQFIADLVLQILSYVAQVERENTRQRQMEGIREARHRGVQFGRPRLPIPPEYDEVVQCIQRGELSLRQGAMRLGVSRTTLRNWMQREEAADSES